MKAAIVNRDPADEQLSLETLHPCPTCDGTGRQPLTNDLCRTCAGSGQVTFDPHDTTIPY